MRVRILSIALLILTLLAALPMKSQRPIATREITYSNRLHSELLHSIPHMECRILFLQERQESVLFNLRCFLTDIRPGILLRTLLEASSLSKLVLLLSRLKILIVQ